MDFFVGTYTEGTKSEGIYTVRFNPEESSMEIINTFFVSNPSFLTVYDRCLYAVSELPSKGKFLKLKIKKDGSLSLEKENSFEGSSSCHIAVGKKRDMVYVANYSSGSMEAIDIRNDEWVNKSFRYTGNGPNKDRQRSSHVHSVNISPNGKHLVVADLGTDKLMVYDIKNNKLDKNNINEYVNVGAGEGPRHVCFHPKENKLYIVTELKNKVISFDYNPFSGEIKKDKEFSVLPSYFSKKSISADIHITPDARYIYVSNRGWDGLAMFFVGDDGQITPQGYFEGYGKTPRNFAISNDGEYIIITYQDSDKVVVAKRDIDSGEIKENVTEIEIPSPVCVLELM